jgi:hypothetical protein
MSNLQSTEVPFPIPGISKPVWALQCPSCKGRFNFCPVSPSCPKPPISQMTNELSPHWTCQMFFGTAGMSVCFVLAQSWKPPQGLLMPCQFYRTSISPTYVALTCVKNLGWDTCINGWHDKLSRLIQLVSLTSEQVAEAWPNRSEGQKIELSLCALHNALRKYLEDVEQCVCCSHISVRSGINAGEWKYDC